MILSISLPLIKVYILNLLLNKKNHRLHYFEKLSNLKIEYIRVFNYFFVILNSLMWQILNPKIYEGPKKTIKAAYRNRSQKILK